MELARVEIEWGVAEKLTKAQCDELVSATFIHPIFDNKPLSFEPTEDGLFKMDYWQRSVIVDLDKIESLKVTLIARLSTGNAIEKAVREDKIAFNERVNVAVPANGLLNITTVKVLEDACTDNLQGEIKAGWKILAICPQADQRRPDYILGKM